MAATPKSSEVEERRKYVSSLQQYLTTCQTELTSVLDHLGWTDDLHDRDGGSERVTCPHDPGHMMPARALERHQVACELRKRGCSQEDVEAICENTGFFYENVPSCATVKLDKSTLNKILWDHHVQSQTVFYGREDMPLTPDDFTVQLSRDERVAVYQSVLLKVREQRDVSGLDKDPLLTANLEELTAGSGDKDKPLSQVEQMAAMRDWKRRRQSYRAKNVHITKKSYTEVIRELIENQTDILKSIHEKEAEVEAAANPASTSNSRHSPEHTERATPAPSDVASEDSSSSRHRKHHKHHKHRHHHKHHHKHRSRRSKGETTPISMDSIKVEPADSVEESNNEGTDSIT